jgi:hypothetical protein
MATNPVVPLPSGFVLDKKKATLPPGFVLDAPKPPTEEPSLGGFAGNVVTSGVGLLEPFLSPIQTAKGTTYSLLGLIEKLSGNKSEHTNFTQYADAVGQELVNRYGSWDAVKKTGYEDPAGLVADIAGLVAGGGGLLKTSANLAGKVGVTASTAAKLQRTGQAVQTTGRAMDPIGLGVRGATNLNRIPYAGRVFNAPFEGAAHLLGVLTGQGAEYMKGAFKTPTPELRAAMRGKSNWSNLTENALGGLRELREAKGAAYRKKMNEIFPDKVIDMTDFRRKVVERLKLERVGVKMHWDKDARVYKPEFNFKQSKIDKQSHAQLDDLLHTIDEWDDNTPEGIDALKQRIDDFYNPGRKSRAVVASIRKYVADILYEEIPGYEQMTSEYRNANELIGLIEKELSLGTTPGVTARKLANAMKESTGYRMAMVDALDQYIPGSLREQITGAGLSSWTPTGIMRPLTGGAILVGGAGGSLGPMDALFVSLTSPRLVGETLVAIARLRDAVTQSPRIARPELLRTGQYGMESYQDINPVQVRFPDQLSVKFPDQEPPEDAVIP